MRRNVDLWAIGLLLAAIGFASELRKSGLVTDPPAQLVEFTMQRVQPLSSVFHLPQLCLARD